MKKPTADKVIFTGPLGEITTALDPHTEADPMGVHMSLIAAFSAYLGPDVRVKSGKGTSPLSIWPVLVGQTGIGRKGTATAAAMQVVTSAWSSWSDVAYGFPATGLGFLGALHERSDEGLARPVLAIEEEMDGFIANTKRDTRLGTYFRKAWDGSDILHKTATSDILIVGTHVAIIGHVQPLNWGAISRSRDATGGTYNRFLPIGVERSKTIPVFGAEDTTELVQQLAKKLRRIARDARDVDMVTVRKDVAEVFEAHHRPACESLTAGNEELAQMSERALAYLIRLAALYALADGRDEIEVEDLDPALAIVKYSVETVAAVLPEVGGDRLTTKIYNALLNAGPDGLSKSELWMAIGRNYSAADVRAALLALPDVEVTVGESTGGRRPEIYRLVSEEVAV